MTAGLEIDRNPQNDIYRRPSGEVASQPADGDPLMAKL
jgi:hypothetical protein